MATVAFIALVLTKAMIRKMAEKSFLPFPEDWKTNPGHPVKTNKKVPLLFTPLKIRGIELKNRIMVSPM